MDEIRTNEVTTETTGLAPVIAETKHINFGKVAGVTTLIAAAGAGAIWLYKRHKAKKAYQALEECKDDEFDDSYFDDEDETKK